MLVRSLLILLLVAGSAAPAVAATYDVDAVHSSVNFRIRHMRVSLALGRFNEFAGTIRFDESNLDACSVDMSVKTASVDTANEQRDAHLKNADYFDAEKYPEITFRSTAWKLSGGKKYEVTGSLTLHGTTRTVVATVEYLGSAPGRKGGRLAGFLAKLSIRRSEFGMKNSLGPIGDEVELEIAVESVERMGPALEESSPQPESWDVLLTGIKERRLIHVVALVRKVTGMSLFDTGEQVGFVDYMPVPVRTSLSQADADALTERLRAAGGEAEKRPGTGAPRPLGEPDRPPYPISSGPVDVVLKYRDTKVSILKVVREITGLGLAEAQALIQSAPVALKSSVTIEEGQALREKLRKAGAVTRLRPVTDK